MCSPANMTDVLRILCLVNIWCMCGGYSQRFVPSAAHCVTYYANNQLLWPKICQSLLKITEDSSHTNSRPWKCFKTQFCYNSFLLFHISHEAFFYFSRPGSTRLLLWPSSELTCFFQHFLYNSTKETVRRIQDSPNLFRVRRRGRFMLVRLWILFLATSWLWQDSRCSLKDS